MLTRRQFQRVAAGALAASRLSAAIDSRVNGVQIGAQSYSFRDRGFDEMIQGFKDVGLGECELWQGHTEPKHGSDLTKWRETVSLDTFKEFRKKFDDAGINLYAFNYSFSERMTDAEIERGFEMAKALGVSIITSSSTLPVVDRVDKQAQKYKLTVGFHGHSNMKPGEFNGPESFAQAMHGRSKYIAVNLDIGHFTAADFDAVDYIQKNHDRIVSIHVKDRKKHQGSNVPFGEGDTPIKAVLQLMKENRYSFPANIEYEYRGGDTVAEVKKCFEYCKSALA